MSRTYIFVALLVLLFLVSPSSHPTPILARTAATFTVNDTSDATDANPGDGICETASGNGICTLRAAIQETNALTGSDTIDLPSGIYTLTIAGANEDNAATGDLDIKDDLTILGEGADTTIIDGNQLDRVFEIFSPAIVNISGVTLRNGSPPFGEHGGGILNSGMTFLYNVTITANHTNYSLPYYALGGGISNSGVITISHSEVSSNSASAGGGIANQKEMALIGSHLIGNSAYAGGAIANLSATSNINSSSIVANIASFGGGIDNNMGTLKLNNSAVISNTAQSSWGGGIYNYFGSADLTRVSVIGNKVNGAGGGIYAWDSPINISAGVLSGNIAAGEGGAIASYGGQTQNLVIKESTLDDNGAYSGGAIFVWAVPVTVINSVIRDNNAKSNGGGIYNQTSSEYLNNTTISYNSAKFGGGGLYHDYASVFILLVNVTINSNSAAQGGGIYDGYKRVVYPVLFNTIISNNKNGGNCAGGSNPVSSGHNLEDANTCGLNASGDLTNTNPLLGPLQDNGGNTLTHALLSGSPAIDAGDNIGCPFTDQRGVLRPYGRACDIGAFELHYPYWMPLLFDNAP